jgi:hypothetical protein
VYEAKSAIPNREPDSEGTERLVPVAAQQPCYLKLRLNYSELQFYYSVNGTDWHADFDYFTYSEKEN